MKNFAPLNKSFFVQKRQKILDFSMYNLVTMKLRAWSRTSARTDLQNRAPFFQTLSRQSAQWPAGKNLVKMRRPLKFFSFCLLLSNLINGAVIHDKSQRNLGKKHVQTCRFLFSFEIKAIKSSIFGHFLP